MLRLASSVLIRDISNKQVSVDSDFGMVKCFRMSYIYSFLSVYPSDLEG